MKKPRCCMPATALGAPGVTSRTPRMIETDTRGICRANRIQSCLCCVVSCICAHSHARKLGMAKRHNYTLRDLVVLEIGMPAAESFRAWFTSRALPRPLPRPKSARGGCPRRCGDECDRACEAPPDMPQSLPADTPAAEADGAQPGAPLSSSLWAASEP